MLRKDLKPGTIFLYEEDTKRGVAIKFWVVNADEPCPRDCRISTEHPRYSSEKVVILTEPAPDKPDAPHYASLTPEPIDVIDAWELGFHLGNALKYIARAGRKVGAEPAVDLRKAVTYIERHIASLEGRRAWK